jgi:hypothetical protein
MTSLEEFVSKVIDFSGLSKNEQVDYFAYYLIAEEGSKGFTPKQISNCFFSLSLKPHNRLPQYLSGNVKSETGKYVKSSVSGYLLERTEFERIKKIIENEPETVSVSHQLRDLVIKVKDSQEKSFLLEAINCYRMTAYRATIVLVWILVMDHLYKHVFGTRLNDFNVSLARRPDKKIVRIVSYDDFLELKESKFIEICRSTGIISNDVRKILDEKLGIRNSAAHPSGITFSGHKTTEFVLDLIENVLLKF